MRTLIATLLVSLTFISANAHASCTQAAVLGAPKIPELQNSSYQEVLALQGEVHNYVETAQARLERCDGENNPFFYNMAVMRLEKIAGEFNQLARHYNAVAVALN
ncbi:hypothetical protein I6N98_00230 [Spongiibacter nanhainus]|uniref:Uncharacterized protein n=1 Tax=Spongiibacter nanhainus TaxID=2794344 RepID=A0A7T4R0U3_9GAMM|nr:hypothetical protein [Spongiibacter nanhainus]QQD18341.1 hypothetical protein I6N98_00230 [Spongiibacter nanhainus]